MRSNALPPPRRSPLQSPSWPATRPPSSQAPPWPSTAAARSTDLDRAPPETEEKSMTLTPERIVADRRELRDRWYAEGFYGSQTLGQQFLDAVTTQPNASYIFAGDHDERPMSLAAVADEALRACLGLQALGVRPGDVVAVQVPNRAELVISYYGAWLAGAVVVPITHIYGPSEMSFILRESGAKVLWVPDRWRNIDFVDRVASLEPLTARAHVVYVSAETPPGAISWQDLLATGPDTTSAAPGAHADAG